MNSTGSAGQQVDQLIAMYRDYKALIVRQADCRRQLAKAKLRRENTAQLQSTYDSLVAQMQLISDKMTYASPSIWVLYKYEAYANEPQAIRTLADFRQHCGKPGYICTKRFDFLNAAMAQRGEMPLTDSAAFPDAMILTNILPAIRVIENDESFMRAWCSHEYYHEGDRIAKWENV